MKVRTMSVLLVILFLFPFLFDFCPFKQKTEKQAPSFNIFLCRETNKGYSHL